MGAAYRDVDRHQFNVDTHPYRHVAVARQHRCGQRWSRHRGGRGEARRTHGFCRSIYFGGPEGLVLELTAGEAIDDPAWIDPEVVGLAGIDDAELARYRDPADYQRPAEAVPQPALDRDKPHLNFPDDICQMLATASDDDIRASVSDSEPPVKVSD